MIKDLFSHEWAQIVWQVGMIFLTPFWGFATVINIGYWRDRRKEFFRNKSNTAEVRKAAKDVAIYTPTIVLIPIWPVALLAVPIAAIVGLVFGTRGLWRGANQLRRDLRGEIE